MTRLLAHVALALIILAAMFMLVGVQERARALAEAQRDLASHAQFTANALDRVLQIRMTQTFTFAALPSLRGFAASDEAARPAHAVIAQTELQAIAAADPNVRACSITDIGGNVILTTDGSMNKNWGERLFAREALAGQLHASVPSRDFGEISQYYSAPILDNAGNVAGALVIRVAVQEMWDLLGRQADMFVVDENGVRIADRSAAPQTFVALAPLAPTVAANLIAEKRYGAEITQIRATNLPDLAAALKRVDVVELDYRDSTNRLVYAALSHLGVNRWTVVVFQSEDVIAEGTWRVLATQIVIAIVAFGSGAAVTYVLLRARETTI